jgi:hypothetical protein
VKIEERVEALFGHTNLTFQDFSAQVTEQITLGTTKFLEELRMPAPEEKADHELLEFFVDKTVDIVATAFSEIGRGLNVSDAEHLTRVILDARKPVKNAVLFAGKESLLLLYAEKKTPNSARVQRTSSTSTLVSSH